MKLTILSLKGKEFEGSIKAFNVKTQSGEITVLDNHLPIVTLLKKGTAVITKSDGSKENFQINSGFLELSENNLSVLVD
ncbi:F0F1 ATP synthase subunit epsilon [Candidatus Giovannonibacteria bacterium]|nr:F0F1 ATP synthase subunit epsilon [Candidatus Giovannonibacteria bacterium]